MDKVKAFLAKIFTEDNGADICIAKIMAVIAFVAYLGYAIYGLVMKDHYAIGEFANGLLQVMGGSAAVVGAKNVTTKS